MNKYLNKFSEKTGWIVGRILRLLEFLFSSILGLIIILGTFIAVNWPLYLFKWTVNQQDWIHYSTIVIAFAYLGFMCWGFSHPKYFSLYKNDNFLGKVLPLMVVISFFFLASGCFGSLTSELADHGRALLVPMPELNNFAQVTDFYLWHAFNLLPGVDMPQTLNWQCRFEYKDDGTAWLLLLFKAIIVWIVIYHIKRWNEWRKENKQKENTALKNKIYASYGIIMKELQNSELLLTQLYYCIKKKRGEIKSEEIKNEIYSNRLKDTFGQLLKNLRDIKAESEVNLNNEFFDKIKKLRDHYAHSFFKEFTSFDSVNLTELLDANKFAYNKINEENILLQNELRTLLEKYNYTKSEIEGMIEITSEGWEKIIA